VGGLDLQIPLGEWDKSTLLAHEREMLGLYVSDHPLLGVEHVLAQAADCTVAQLLEDRGEGAVATIGGLVTSVSRKTTRTGDAWAIVTVEDLDGGVEIQVYPRVYRELAVHLTEDTILLMKVRVDRREDAPRFIGLDATLPDLTTEAPTGPLVIRMAASRCVPPVVDQLKRVLSTHPGMTEVHLQMESAAGAKVFRFNDGHRVALTPALYGDLKALLGPGCVA
jgi:DNA polymerase-3 subunit alpha